MKDYRTNPVFARPLGIILAACGVAALSACSPAASDDAADDAAATEEAAPAEEAAANEAADADAGDAEDAAPSGEEGAEGDDESQGREVVTGGGG